MPAKDIALKNLQRNNYNPRSRYDDAAMADLKESIDAIGLDTALTVRPIDENGTYEVVNGDRRYLSLDDLYGEDYQVPCNVKDFTDEEARWHALAENLVREDLTAVEEAWGFADIVTVDYRGEEESYAEYIKDTRTSDRKIRTPSQDNPGVERLSGQVPTPGSTIRKRLRLLSFPDDVLTLIENEELGLEAARVIAVGLGKLPDAESREKEMRRLAEQAASGHSTVEELQEKAEATVDEWEDRQQQDVERVEGFADAATSAESDLRSELVAVVEWYNGREDTSEDLSTNGETTLLDAANNVTSALQDRIAALGGERLTELDDEESDLKKERNRLEQNVEIVRKEGHDRCPFCKAGILIPDIEDRIAEYEREIEAVQEQKSALNDDREAYRDRRSDLREVINEFEDSVERLRSQLDSKDIEPDDLDATVPDAVTNGGGG